MDKKEQGKKNRSRGARFELSVRKDLESKGWIVSKWQNNVEFGTYTKGSFNEFEPRAWKDLTLQNGDHYPGPCARLIPAKRKYNPFNKALSIGVGFPDFIAYTFKQIKIDLDKSSFKITEEKDKIKVESGLNEELIEGDIPTIIGVEAKSNGYIDPEEKEKIRWMLSNKIFSKILIAKKGEKRGEIIYEEANI